jgi:hypothetical protein
MVAVKAGLRMNSGQVRWLCSKARLCTGFGGHGVMSSVAIGRLLVMFAKPESLYRVVLQGTRLARGTSFPKPFGARSERHVHGIKLDPDTNPSRLDRLQLVSHISASSWSKYNHPNHPNQSEEIRLIGCLVMTA